MELVIAAFSLVIFSSIAVNWHRYILLDEITASEKIFRLDRPVWNYAGPHPVDHARNACPDPHSLDRLFGAPCQASASCLRFRFFVAGIYIMRMSVALPAIALERKDFGIYSGIAGNPGQQPAVCRTSGAERLDPLRHIC